MVKKTTVVLFMLCNFQLGFCNFSTMGSIHQDYFLCWERGQIHLGKVDIDAQGARATTDIQRIEPFDTLVDGFTVSQKSKRILVQVSKYLSDTDEFQYQLIETDYLGKSRKPLFNVPKKNEIKFPRISNKDYLCYLYFSHPDRNLPYYSLSIYTTKNMEKSLTYNFPYKIDYTHPPSWNAESNLISVSSLSAILTTPKGSATDATQYEATDNGYVYSVELNGKSHQLCKGMYGVFSPTQNDKIAIVESSQSLILATIDKNFNIIQKLPLLKFHGTKQIGFPALVWSLDGNRIYFHAGEGYSGALGVGILYCIDVNSKILYKVTPEVGWLGGFAIAPPP